MEWSQTKISEMLDLQKKGYSASEIGKMIGCSRNAVIGKTHRLTKQGKATTLPLTRKPYLSELSYGSWSSPRYRE